jgi:hydroxyacylglutathione hydrolase
LLFERIWDHDLAQTSYLIGCQASGAAAVVDARWDIHIYRDLARKYGMEIVAVAETHFHTDYLSGTRELAAATGARIYVSGEGGPDRPYRFPGEMLNDDDEIPLGSLTLRAMHTPCRSPEHLSFLVTDSAVANEPGYLLSGDFVCCGDVGRPRQTREGAGIDSRVASAQQLFTSLRDKFLTLPDYVQVHPGHGAGSACCTVLGSAPSTTVGYEPRFAWWAPYLSWDDQEGFVDEILGPLPLHTPTSDR